LLVLAFAKRCRLSAFRSACRRTCTIYPEKNASVVRLAGSLEADAHSGLAHSMQFDERRARAAHSRVEVRSGQLASRPLPRRSSNDAAAEPGFPQCTSIDPVRALGRPQCSSSGAARELRRPQCTSIDAACGLAPPLPISFGQVASRVACPYFAGGGSRLTIRRIPRLRATGLVVLHAWVDGRVSSCEVVPSMSM
jgi:hypothetical protein